MNVSGAEHNGEGTAHFANVCALIESVLWAAWTYELTAMLIAGSTGSFTMLDGTVEISPKANSVANLLVL